MVFLKSNNNHCLEHDENGYLDIHLPKAERSDLNKTLFPFPGARSGRFQCSVNPRIIPSATSTSKRVARGKSPIGPVSPSKDSGAVQSDRAPAAVLP